MKLNLSRRILLATALLFSASICEAKDAATTVPIPAKFDTLTQVTLVLEGHCMVSKLGLKSNAEQPQLHRLTIRLINPTAGAIHFRGYAESQPCFAIEYWIDGDWVEHRVVGVCGTGRRDCRIGPGESSVISVDFTEKRFPLRVGVSYSNGVDKSNQPKMVWSERIEGDSLMGEQPAAKRQAE